MISPSSPPPPPTPPGPGGRRRRGPRPPISELRRRRRAAIPPPSSSASPIPLPLRALISLRHAVRSLLLLLRGATKPREASESIAIGFCRLVRGARDVGAKDRALLLAGRARSVLVRETGPQRIGPFNILLYFKFKFFF